MTASLSSRIGTTFRCFSIGPRNLSVHRLSVSVIPEAVVRRLIIAAKLFLPHARGAQACDVLDYRHRQADREHEIGTVPHHVGTHVLCAGFYGEECATALCRGRPLDHASLAQPHDHDVALPHDAPDRVPLCLTRVSWWWRIVVNGCPCHLVASCLSHYFALL